MKLGMLLRGRRKSVLNDAAIFDDSAELSERSITPMIPRSDNSSAALAKNVDHIDKEVRGDKRRL